jgi:hypothetical protein
MLEFDVSAVAAALPASVQAILTARVDRLAPKDRALLQAASVIERQFDPQLLAGAVGETDVDERLAAMQALDLVLRESKSDDYAFKHVLVRDALYQSLLTEPRKSLHLKVAEEIERRSGNRLTEVAEVLARHYRQTDHVGKAFAYLSMAGSKSLSVYSLDEADNYFAAAIALLDQNPDCASDQQVVELFVDYTLCSNMSMRWRSMTEIVERFMSRIDQLSDSQSCVLVQHQYVLALLWSGRYREAEKVQYNLSTMAARLQDARSTAYSLASAIHVSTIFAPTPVEIFDARKREVIAAASNVDDVYVQCFARFVIMWEEIHRGQTAKAHEGAEELIAVGRQMNDPRSIGWGMALRAWVALLSDDYLAALNFAEISISIARTPYDQELAKTSKIAALVLLRRQEGFAMLRDRMDQCATNGWHWYQTGYDGIWGVALVVCGEIGGGIRWMEQSILKREREGYRAAADWYRMFLCEIYLQIISGTEKPSAKVLTRNILTLVRVMFTAQRRISTLVGLVRQNPQLDPNGHHTGRLEMILGLLYKTKKKRTLAVQHLTETKRIISQFGPTPMLARIDAALAELG